MTPAPRPCDVAELLVPLRGEPFYYVPNTGNAGDGLIACATLQLFGRLGLRWTLVRAPEDAWRLPAGSVVVLGGGGHMNRFWNGFADLVEALHLRAKRLLVLPHTIEGNAELLSALGSNVDVVCRETVSYAHVRAHARGGARVHLADDLAFGLDVDALLRGRTWRGRHELRALRGETLRKAWRLLGHRLAVVARRGRPRVLDCFRQDAEAAGWSIPRYNLDLSWVFASRDARYDEADAARSARALVSYVDRFDVIRTDRMHVGIVGALLGKEVHLHVGAYYKIEAVYRTSIAGRFPRVCLVMDPPVPPAQGAGPAIGEDRPRPAMPLRSEPGASPAVPSATASPARRRAPHVPS